MDSGSTGNYISDRCLAALNVPVVPEEEHENLTLADGSVVQAQGYAQFMLRCGDFKCPIIARVFPNLQQELILGMPRLIQENPNIAWAARTVRVMRRGVIHNLPTIYPAIGGDTDEMEAKVNCISEKAFKRAIRKRRIKEDTVFLGLIHKLQEPTEQVDVAMQYKGKSDLGAVHVWREDMPECIKAILKEYNDIFPQDLPPGLPPVRVGHEFRIDLEDDTPPSPQATLQAQSARAQGGSQANSLYA